MFGLFKKEKRDVFTAPVTGELMPLEALKDGVFERKDMTGFNWSQRPVIILEMGFMSNWEDDALLGDKLYQQKIADLIVKSLEKYRVEL